MLGGFECKRLYMGNWKSPTSVTLWWKKICGPMLCVVRTIGILPKCLAKLYRLLFGIWSCLSLLRQLCHFAYKTLACTPVNSVVRRKIFLVCVGHGMSLKVNPLIAAFVLFRTSSLSAQSSRGKFPSSRVFYGFLSQNNFYDSMVYFHK